MIKLIGALLIIGISTMAGFFYSQRFTERCKLLSLWLRIIEIFETEIYFESRRLPEVFSKTASLLQERRFSRAFDELISSLNFGADQDFTNAWSFFLAETGVGVLSNEDYQVLEELGNYLGSTNREDQLVKLKSCRASLTRNLQAAEDERNKQSRIYRYLGFAIGAITVLWLI